MPFFFLQQRGQGFSPASPFIPAALLFALQRIRNPALVWREQYIQKGEIASASIMEMVLLIIWQLIFLGTVNNTFQGISTLAAKKQHIAVSVLVTEHWSMLKSLEEVLKPYNWRWNYFPPTLLSIKLANCHGWEFLLFIFRKIMAVNEPLLLSGFEYEIKWKEGMMPYANHTV